MRIARYFLREVLSHTVAVSAILLVIILSGRFVKYLAEAASGDLAAEVLLPVMWFRLPGFLELILPLGLFIGILMAYGRLYIESEMVVLAACGTGPGRLALYTLAPALLVAIVVAILSLYVTPAGAARSQALLDDPRSRQGLSTLTAGRFQVPRGGGRVTYTEQVAPGGESMRGVLIVDWEPGESGTANLAILAAESGHLVPAMDGDGQFLEFRNGTRYQGNPGEAVQRVVHFTAMGERVREPRDGIRRTAEIDGVDTATLLHRDDLQARAALQWRLSTPLLVPLVALLALAMSRTDQRRGRYWKMAPALLLYLLYLLLLSNGRAAIEKGQWPLLPGLWLVHTAFALVVLALLLWPLRRRRRMQRA